MRRPVQIEAAQTTQIDGLQGETFFIRLVTSIENLWVKNISPGQIYIFVLIQNEAGGHTVNWGAQALNASQPDPVPHSVTVQNCIGTTGGTLQSNIPGVWS